MFWLKHLAHFNKTSIQFWKTLNVVNVMGTELPAPDTFHNQSSTNHTLACVHSELNKSTAKNSQNIAHTRHLLWGFSSLERDETETLYLPFFTSLSISCLLCLLCLFISFIRRPSLTLSTSPPSACSRVHTSSSLFHFPSLCGERRALTALWQRQSADAGLKSDRPCPAATLLGSRRSITPVACPEQHGERERKAQGGGEKEDGWVWKGGNVESKKARRKKE